MTEPVATPGSTAESATPAKPLAVKDRACPYCNTLFTSSSLGRHLDLYIKEKNPKPPDGIHDIDEIRRSRGNITRRQARTSSAKRDGSTPSSSKPTPLNERRSPSVNLQYTNGHNSDHVDRASVAINLNRANWHITGVINDLPQTPRDGGPKHDPRRDQQRRLSIKSDIKQRQKTLDEKDTGRAAELALREILDSIKAANAQAHDPGPFEFDFFAQSFPSLCLRCLSRPASIFNAMPESMSDSWPVGLPGSVQLDSIQKRLGDRLRWWRKSRAYSIKYNGTTSVGELDQAALGMKESQPYYEHLNNIFNNWKSLPDLRKQEMWHLESLRAFARERQEHGETHIKLQRAEQEVAYLKTQVDHLNKCQQPREFLLFPPSMVPFSRRTADVLCENSPRSDLDYDALVSKWKLRIQNSRNTQKSLPPVELQNIPTPLIPSPQLNNGGGPSFDRGPINGDGQSYVYQDDDASDSDLMDAPGEEDEDLHEHGGDMDGVLDPKLRVQLDEAVMQGIERDGRNRDRVFGVNGNR